MQNQEFYVKYKENQAVKISTLIDSGRKKREFPLTDVADLVAAYFPNTAPNELAQYTLHSSENEPGALAGNGLLSSIGPGTGTFDNPFVIRSLNDTAVAKLPKLGDPGWMYDVFSRLSSRATSTPSKHTGPSYHRTQRICEILSITDSLCSPLSDSEKEAISNHDNALWKNSFRGVVEAVDIGSTEVTVDRYVSLIINSVADALKLKLRLEQQSFINGKKADHWVIAFGQDDKQGWIVGCNENKLPKDKYKEPYVTDNNKFLVRIYDQMMEVYNYYGTSPVLSIGSTGREWRFFKLPLFESNMQADASSSKEDKSKEQDDYSPLSGNMGQAQFDGDDDEMDVVEQVGAIQEEKKIELFATNVYKWNDKEMLFTLGSVLKEMASSKRKLISSVTNESLKDRVMWHLIKSDIVLPWGWAKLTVSKLHWSRMVGPDTDNVIVLGLLGKGADGKVLLVACKKGHVSAMKLIKDTEDEAEKEAEIWNNVYNDYCKQYKWNIRSEKWMGTPAVIMPVFAQFSTEEDRLNNLSAVRNCLRLFHARGYRHDDIYWRNIGYFKTKGETVVVMLDLHPTRVFKQDNDSDNDESWIDDALQKLIKKRASYLNSCSLLKKDSHYFFSKIFAWNASTL